MLTKEQQDYLDNIIAHAGKPSAALQCKLDELRAATSECELTKIFCRDAHLPRTKMENELLCAVMISKQIELKSGISTQGLKDAQHEATHQAALEPVRTVPAEPPAASLGEHRDAQSKQKAMFNVIRALVVVVLLILGAFALLSALFDKKHSGPAIEYLHVYTTINGQFYEKEATADDLKSTFVTFEDGTRVPWSAVHSKKMKVYADELTNALFQGQSHP